MTATTTRPTRRNMDAANEQAASAIEPRQPIEFELVDQKYQGALFQIDPAKRSDRGPLMSGNLAVGQAKVPLSAFFDVSQETGTEYLNLSLGGEGGVHYYGRLFRTAQKKSERSPDYSGYFHVLAVRPGDEIAAEEWEQSPKLKVYGRRVRNADNSVRIALDVAPTRSIEPIEDSELPF